MKKSLLSLGSKLAVALVALAALLLGQSAQAASSSWNINNAGNWNAAGSWDANGIPGSTTLLDSPDIATFGFILTGDRIVTVDTDRNIGGITFSGNTTNFKYTLSGGNLLLTSGGVIQVNSSANGGTHTDTISSAIAIQGDGGAGLFTNNGNNSRVLSLGAVTGVSTAGKTTVLTLNGSSTGANAVTGIIGDGAGGGSLAIMKSDNGVWNLTGANTYTGKTIINAGTLRVSSLNSVNGGTPLLASSSLGAPTTVATGTIDLSGTLYYTGTGETTDRVINLAGVAGSPALEQAGSGLLKFTSNILATGPVSKTLSLQGGSGTGEISGSISDYNAVYTTSLIKNGGNTWVLSGANTYSGKTTIANGTLSVSSLNSVVGGTATSSLGAPITIANGTIDLASSNSSVTLRYTGLGETTDRVLNLSGTTGSVTIDQSGASGLLKFTSNLTATGLGAKVLTLQGALAGTGEIAGAIVDNSALNTTSLLKSGSGTWTLSGANTYTGLTTVSAGTLAISGSGTLGATTAPLTVTSGTLDLGGTSQTVGAVLLTGSGGMIQNGNLTGTSYTASNTSGTTTVSAVLQGSGVTLNRTGAGGTLALTNANTYTGTTNVTAGTLSVSGAAGAINSSSAYAVSGGILTLDNTAGSLERLNDSADVTLSRGGSLNLIQGNAASDATETIANLAFDTGNSTVTISSQGGMVTTLAVTGSLTRANNATGLVRGSSMGIQATNVGKITLGTLPSGANFVGAGGAPTSPTGSTTKNLAIVPWLVGDTSTGNSGKAFVTYDNTGGLRPLVAGELDALSAGYTTTGNNVSQTASITLTAGTHDFNSLFITGNSNLTGAGAGDSLTIASGALANAGSTTISGFDDGITFGNGEGVITAIGALNINNSINVTSGGGITKAGGNTLTLIGAQAYTGATTVNQGTLRLGNGTTDATLASSGINTAVGGTTNFSNIAASTYSGALSGGGAFTKTGAGVLTLTGSGAGTGNGAGTLTITVGGVKLGTANALQNTTASIGMVNGLTFEPGVSPFTIGGLAGNSNLALVDTSAGAIALQVGNNNADTTYGGVLSLGGSLVKIGTGTLTLTGINTFTGGLTIKSGTLTSTLNTSLGAGPVTLGDTSGSNAATLLVANSLTIGNAITLATNASSGTLTIGRTSGNSTTTFTGGVTGTNNLTFDSTNPLNGGTTFSTASINNAGTFTNVGTGTGTTTISGGVGSNVTGIIQNSTTSALTISTTALTVNSVGTTLTNSGGRAFNVSAATAGTGHLILKNNSSLASGITLSGAVNHTGTLTNSGNGTNAAIMGTTVLSLDRSVMISGIIGPAVTSVIQDSATSVMELTGVNTMSGTTRVHNGTLILGNAAAGGTSQLRVGDTGGSANAALRLRALTVVNNVLVQAGSSGTATLGGAASGAASAFSGTVTLDKNVILSPYNNNLNFTGVMSGVGGISVVNAGQFTNSSGQSYGIGGGTVVLSRTDNANTFQGNTSVLSGTLQLSGNATASASLNGLLGTSTNDVLVGDTSGFESARLVLNLGAAGQTFSRNITIQAGSGGIAGIGSGNLTVASLSGNVSLGKSAYLFNTGSGTPVNVFSGSFTKDVAAIGATSITTSGAAVSKLTNTGNNYDGGSIAGGVGTLWGEGAGAYGTGNAVAELGAIRLSDQVALASGKKVYVGQFGAVSIGTNSAAQIAYIASVLDATSSGALSLGIGISNVINLASFGNGNMTLGADNAGANYSAATLGANLDGNYRIGYGKQTVTITTGALVGGSAQLIVGTPGNSNSGGNASNLNMSGGASLTATNTYGGGTVVNLGSTLFGTQRTVASESPFGSSTGAMAVRGATLRLQNNGTSAIGTTVGAFSFDGNSIVQVDGVTGGANSLTVGAMTRNGNGVLNINTSGTGAVLGTTAIFKTTGSVSTTTAKVTGGIDVEMVAPYIVDGSNANFMTYDVTTGFTPISNGYDTTNFTGLPTNAIVKLTGSATLNADTTIYALGTRTLAAATITNTSGTDKTLTISSGGVYYDGRTGSVSMVIGSNVAGQRVNLDFNGQEAIFTGYTSNNSSLQINSNIVNATGLTKSGNASLALRGTGSSFEGPITLLSGGANNFVSISVDLNLGGVGNALNNGVVFNGGKLLIDNGGTMNLSATRTLTIGEHGGTITSLSSGNYGASTVIIDSKITGTTGGYLNLFSQMTGNAANTVSSSFTFTNAANDFVAPIFVGTASNGGGPVFLAFDTNSQLGNAANSVSIMGGNAALRYTGSGAISSARGINFFELGGGLEVSSATGVWTNSGVLAGSGLFNKMGAGKMVLTGSNTYTGNTIVSGGVLNVQHANALGASTAAITGDSGVSGGAAYVQSGAALEVQGTVALGGAGGKTMYLNGTGISNGGSLRNVSGDNSNAGDVVLQTNTAIGADAGKLTLAGKVSGASALTKVGTGTLALDAVNSYSGATNVNAGTMLVNGSTAATSAFTVSNSGTVLGGRGTINGATTINAGAILAPGASAGLLTFGSSLSFTDAAKANFEIATGGRGTTYDAVNVTGLLTYNGDFTLTIGAALENTTYDLFGGTGAGALNQTGYFDSLSFSGSGYSGTWVDAGSGVWTVSSNGQDFSFSQLTGDLNVVPEPATWALLAFSLTTVVILRRRRMG